MKFPQTMATCGGNTVKRKSSMPNIPGLSFYLFSYIYYIHIQQTIHSILYIFREYYRCTYRNTHGCCATKQVQRSSDDPSIFEITYLGKHTCPKISTSSATESGYGLINFSSTPETASKTSRSSDPSSATQSSSAITRNSNSFELSNWPLNHN